MNKLFFIFGLTTTCLLGGLLVYAIAHDWIIIRLPSNISEYQPIVEPTIKRKNVTLSFWHENKWEHEAVQIIWSNKEEQNIKNLGNKLLNLLDEEGVMEKKVTIQSVALTNTKTECYVSLDQDPFAKETSTYRKWMLIESLLKTLRENGTSMQGIFFLVHHKTLNDDHLDFTNAWPIQGFIQQT
ncbi:hypothetical protein HN446_01880 [bacterium]|jgi:hypothetical protein|nr:hypothetical protein [bacterium]